MKLTAKKAVELSIELWEWLAETGLEKNDWPKWKENDGRHPQIKCDCFLCEYAEFLKGRPLTCKRCPYYKKYQISCFGEGMPFDDWVVAMEDNDVDETKKFAKLFLEQLKTILKEMDNGKRSPNS